MTQVLQISPVIGESLATVLYSFEAFQDKTTHSHFTSPFYQLANYYLLS